MTAAALAVSFGCGAAANDAVSPVENPVSAANASAPLASTITFKENGPADTVKAFYTKLRENKIREAIYLTNLRPAVEGLSDDELKEFSVDFANVAKKVPPAIQITGEIVSGELATVTANLPNDDDKLEPQTIQLRKNGDYWVIQTVDPAAEELIKKEGKNYFRALKIESHQEDAKSMLERVAKAQILAAGQNEGLFADMETLIKQGFVPEDIRTSESTGYVYSLTLTEGGKNYFATATPAEYRKTGISSYILKPQEKGMPVVTGRDNGGKPLTK